MYLTVIFITGSLLVSDGGEAQPIACGPAALRASARLVGRGLSRHELREALGGQLTGIHSFQALQGAANRLGLACRPVRFDPRSPHLARLPLIIPIRRAITSTAPDHFVVLFGRCGANLTVYDGLGPPRCDSLEEFAGRWDGDGLYIAANERDLAAARGRPADGNWLVALAALGVIGAGTRMYLRSPVPER